MARPKKDENQTPSKDKLLEAATKLIRAKGYTATSVDDLCQQAGVSKGTFFHNFKSKEDLAVAAAQNWSLKTGEFFKAAPYHKKKDPLERLLGYIRFRKELLQGDLPEFTCLVGTMVQEIYDSNPEITHACYESIFSHAEILKHDIAEAKELYAKKSKWSAEGLALHTQAVIQGAFILAKASGDADMASESIDHLENYIRLLFNK